MGPHAFEHGDSESKMGPNILPCYHVIDDVINKAKIAINPLLLHVKPCNFAVLKLI